MKRLMFLMCGLSTAFAFGADLYVDRSGANGAYASINSAIAAANDHDTVWVRPGVYDNDPADNVESANSDVSAIVYVTKPLHIIATDPDPANTKIVGRFDPDTLGTPKKGAGPKAVRCVRFSKAASADGAFPSVLKGFTICNGGCYTEKTDPDDDCGQPGGVAGRSGIGANFYVTDCVISNCVGVRGGLVSKGIYVRCRFSDGHGLAGQAVGRELSLLNCLVTHMSSMDVVMDGNGCVIVNTTFADMDTAPYCRRPVPLYNCVIASCVDNRATLAQGGTAFNSLLSCPEVADNKTNCKDQITDNIPYPFIAPLKGDFRLRKGTEACGLGDAAHIATCFPSAPAIVEIYKDLGGKNISETGAINPGCYQETVEAKTGIMQVSSSSASKCVSCNGYCGQFPFLYASGADAFETFNISSLPGEHPAFVCLIGDFYRYPDMDDHFHVLPPPIGQNVTNVMTVSTCEYWVDPTNGVDGAVADGFGTAEKPFKTLQYPCDLAAQGGFTYIHAAAGVYDEGGRTYDLHTNRVCIMSTRNAYIKGAGRGKSIIVGKKDVTSPNASKGMGPAAVRCVLNDYDTYGCVQGFTLKESYADYSSSNDDSRQFSGGFFCVMHLDSRQHVLADCEIAGDGQAFRGAIAYGGSLVRCVVHGYRADGQWGGAIRSASVENCVFYDNDWGSSNLPNVDTPFFGCTLTSDIASPVTHVSADLKMENCIVQAGGASPSSDVAVLANVKNTLMWGYESVSGSDSLFLADPRFADLEARDYRLKTSSPAFSLGFKPLADDWLQVQTDVNGKPRLRLNGCVVPGAVQTAVEVVSIAEPKAGSFDKTGEIPVEAGESVTVTFVPDASTHAYLGLEVDGELQADEVSCTYTSVSPFAADGSAKPPVVVKAAYQTNWYVNANVDAGKGVVGDDANDGQTSATPWRTLAKLQAMKDVFWAGDVVHAAAGDYNDLTVLTTVESVFIPGYGQLPSRVEVPENVTLVADAGPDVTFITGASGSGTYGMGPGAVRCASICDGGRLERFTLRGGRTFNEDTDGDQFCGGGVFAKPILGASNCGIVYGCVITNCVGQRGGAVRNGRAVNCRILDCGAGICAPAGSASWFLGCYINGCKYNHQLMRESYFVGNCTFGPSHDYDGSLAVNEIVRGYGGVVNCVFLNKLMALCTDEANHYKSCKFMKMDESVSRMCCDANCEEFDSAEAFGLDPTTGEPIAKTAGVVDAGGEAIPAYGGGEALFADTDVDGVQRVYNGTRDAGCWEYDWRSVYSTDLGATVTKADPQVVEQDGQVLVKGGTLAFSFPENDSGRKARYTVPFEVTGTGTLTGARNGEEEAGPWTSADGATSLVYKNADIRNDWAFTYAPGAADAAGALFGLADVYLPGFALIVR